MFGYTAKPKGFHHINIYVDERRERILRLEERIRRQNEEGEITGNGTPYPLFHFSDDTRKFRNYRKLRNTHPYKSLMHIILIVGAVLLCCYFYFC